MKQYFFACIFLLCSFLSKADVYDSFTVGGDADKYYPVAFEDGNWAFNRATKLEIGRSLVHLNSEWRGSMISTFEYHCTNWGSGSPFINANINMTGGTVDKFVAGWLDVSNTNENLRILIWLRGGNTTYYYTANTPVNPVVYDGVQNALPYHEVNGPDYSYKTIIDEYVNLYGASFMGNIMIAGKVYPEAYALDISGGNFQHLRLRGGKPLIKFAGAAYNNANGAEIAQESDGRFFINVNSGLNVFSALANGNVGIGTANPTEKLSVNGTIRTKKVVVTQTGWADYVFAPSYKLPSLDSVAAFIETNKHLPGIPSEAEVKKDGHDVGEMQKLLLQKVEELTLYMLQFKKENEDLKTKYETLKLENLELRKSIQLNNPKN